MKKQYIILLLGLLFFCGSCNDEDFLDKDPTDILLPDQVWSSKVLITNVLADLYDRIPTYQSIVNVDRYAEFNEAYISRNGTGGWFNNNEYGYGSWGLWDYAYVRDLNLFIEKLSEAETTGELTESDKVSFLAEARFLRAYLYFEMVKRMGGIPLILEPLEYDFSGDPTYLRFPRAKEHEVYDFVISELEEPKRRLTR